jgi:hypothetical protein
MFHNTLYRIDNSTDTEELKLVIIKKEKKKYILFVNIQIAKYKAHVASVFFNIKIVVINI